MDQRLIHAAEKLSELVLALSYGRFGALLDLTIGGLASFIEAQRLKYDNREDPLPPEYYKKLSERTKKMASGTLPQHGRWLSGYYFNSGLMRLGAAREQIRKLLCVLDKQKNEAERKLSPSLVDTAIDELYQEYNQLKHDLLGLSGGRRVTFEQAVEALADLVEVLDARKCELSDPKTKVPRMEYKPRRKNK